MTPPDLTREIEPPRQVRPGPRPLGLHLALAGSTWMSAAVALPVALMPGFPWHPSLAGKALELRRHVTAENRTALQKLLVEQAGDRVEKVLAGIEAYRHHPYRRQLSITNRMGGFGSGSLIDYGQCPDQNLGDPRHRPVILCIPSLVNPSYILDLSEQSSLMRFLAGAGFRPLLVDWGTPGEEERAFTLSDYVTRRLEPMLEAALALGQGPVHVVGYCMGGNLALALAARQPRLVRSLALLATPWDFHVASVTQARALAAMLSGIIAAFEPSGLIPVDFLQMFFTSLDPTLSDRKFRRFAGMDQNSAAARLFVAIEDWSNDGAPLAAKVARECLYEWYGENLPARAAWRIDGQVVDPAKIATPSLVVVPASDRIVPPASARALGQALANATVHEVRAGHVAMIAGPQARATLWQPLVAWLDAHNSTHS